MNLLKEIKEKTEKCNDIKDFDNRIRCKSKVLYEVTTVQDHVNLNIMSDFRNTDPRCSQDKRWIPVHMVDNANAVILGISRNKFRPKLFLREGYVDEKINALENKYRRVKWDNND